MYKKSNNNFDLIFHKSKTPNDYEISIVIPALENFRRINLLNTALKIMTNLILQKLNEIIINLCDEQHGFWTGRLCTDIVFAIY